MRSFKLKFVTILAVMMCTIWIGVTSYAHHGKMDQNWGHNDYNNECGFGTYHYHCDNYPAHLHNNGVYPYTSTVSNSSGANARSNSTNNTANSGKNSNNGKNTNAGKNSDSTPAKKSIINAKSVEISGNTVMKVGESVQLTATVTPSDTTNCNIIWNSSDNSIAEVDQNGNVTAKKAGYVNISASTATGIKDEVKLVIEDGVSATNTISLEGTINSTSDNLQENNVKGNEAKSGKIITPVIATILIVLIIAIIVGIVIHNKNKNTENK